MRGVEHAGRGGRLLLLAAATHRRHARLPRFAPGAPHRGRGDRLVADVVRDRRVRPGDGGRRGPRLGDAPGRRPGDREVHHPPPGGAGPGPAREAGPVRLGRGVGGAGEIARLAAGRDRRRHLPDVGNVPRADPLRHRGALPRDADRRLDPDRVLLRSSRGAGFRRPGAGVRRAAHLLREEGGGVGLPRGARDEGGGDRGAAGARAHRGHGPLLRGGEGAPVPDPEGGEEPVRLDERDRRLRDARPRG